LFKAIFLCFLTCVPVLQADQGYIIQTIAGSSNDGDNGPASAALLVQAEGIAIDGLGNIYVADASDNRVRKINPLGVIQTIAGTGIVGFSGDGGAATAAQLNHPYGIALDLAGNVYVADLGNARVRKIDTAGVITTVAGGGVFAITQAAGVQAKDAMLMSPRNVAVDSLNNVYISDFDAHQVYEIAPSGILTVFAGMGKPGLSGDGGAPTLAQISYPAGLATDANGNVFITDSGNGRVRRVWRGIITTVAMNVPSPTGVSVDAAGGLYVASSAVASLSHAPSPAGLSVEVVAAEDVASDPGGTLFLATQHTVQKMAGISLTVIAGAPGFATYGDGGPATSARLGGPVAMAVNMGADIYIAEQSANRIRKVAANGTISIVVSDPAQISGPSGVAIDAAGTIYFADAGNNRVRRISAGGVISTAVDKLNGPGCVRVGPDGSLYVCDKGNDRILKITPSGSVSIAANVGKPAGLAAASDGTLYASTGVQIVQISTAGVSTTLVDGLSGPAGLALNSAGELLIAESGKNRVLKLGAAGAVTVLAGGGQANFGGDGGPSAAALLNNPEDVAVDSTGNILIADVGNNRIRKLTPAPAAVAAPEIVNPITVVNAASQLAGALAPNEIVTMYGTGFDPAHTQVTFDNTPATVFYAGPQQLNVLVPSTVQPNGTTSVNVLAKGSPAGAAIVNTASAALGLFTMSNGTGQAAALNEDGTVNSTNNPAARGTIIVLFITGDGGTAAPVYVRIAEYTADVLYAGPAPGFPGLTQINARVPAGFLPSGTLTVAVTAGGVSSQAGVTIAVR